MHRLPLLLLPVLAAVLGSALIAHASATAPTGFRTPDAGAACRLAGPALVCSSLGSTGSVSLRETSGARVVHVLPWWDASTPVVRRWERNGISCRVVDTAILCRSLDSSSGSVGIRVTGDGFAVTG